MANAIRRRIHRNPTFWSLTDVNGVNLLMGEEYMQILANVTAEKELEHMMMLNSYGKAYAGTHNFLSPPQSRSG